MKLRKREINCQPRDSKVNGQGAGGWKSRRAIAKADRLQLITNLAVKLVVQWFNCRAIKSNHFECHNRTATSRLAERSVH